MTTIWFDAKQSSTRVFFGFLVGLRKRSAREEKCSRMGNVKAGPGFPDFRSRKDGEIETKKGQALYAAASPTKKPKNPWF